MLSRWKNVFWLGRVLILLWIFNAASCEYDNDWWKHNQMYQIVISSFKDSDGDGTGDIKGITSKIDYIAELGFDSIWITPFFKSPKVDMGYDISDYISIDPVYGTMTDFHELIRECRKRSIKVIIDFVVNHSSDEHPWFQKSIDRIKPYDDYYVWKDPKGYEEDGTPIVPNNWRSVFGHKSMWQWNEKRKQFYLHQFSVQQPDLNLRNPRVKKEITNIIAFWMRKGVSGLRVDAPLFYMEDAEFRDNPSEDGSTYTYDQWESYEFIHKIRTDVDTMNRKLKGHERIVMPEAVPRSMNLTWALYGNDTYHMSHCSFNFYYPYSFMYMPSFIMKIFANYWFQNKPKHGVTMWVAETHDFTRIGSRFVPEHTDIVNIFSLMLPEGASIYYGQEIGMLNAPVRWERVSDRLGYRDRYRSPMQWDNSMNAGFTDNLKPWVQMSPNYWHLNVEAQKRQPRSHYWVFRNVSELRKTDACKYGSADFHIISTYVFGFTRSSKTNDTYLTVSNMGAESQTIYLDEQIYNLQPTLEVVASSINSEHTKGQILNKGEDEESIVITLRPLSAIVLFSKGSTNF